MKKRMAMLTAILLCGTMLAACGNNQSAKNTSSAASSSAASSASTSSESEAAAGENTTDAAGENVTAAAGENATEAEAAAAGENTTATEEAAAGENTTETEEAAAGENATETEEAAAGENTTDAEEAAAGENATEASTSESGQADIIAQIMEEAKNDPVMAIPTIDGEYTMAECVKLGDYKGLKLEKEVIEVTDEDVDNQIEMLVQPVETEDETAELKEGDTANLDFTGYLNEEAFEGGSATGYDLEIGSGSFIPGFEEQMIGMKKGEERDLNLTFPENYGSEELAGQDVVFHVKLNAIKQMPEVDDAWAKEQSNGECETLEEFREVQRAEMEEQNQAYADTELQDKAWGQVVENSEILAFPEILLEEKREEYTSYLESEAQMYGMTAEEYIQQMGMTQEVFDMINEVQGRTEVQNDLVLQAIAEAEGVTEEDPVCKEELERMEKEYNMTADEIKENYGEAALNRHLNYKAVISKILSYAEITEKTASEGEE